MQILIKSFVIDDAPTIRSHYFDCIVNPVNNYIIQYGGSDDIDDHVQLFTNGFDDDKLLELMRCIKHYHPQFEWIENK